MVRAGATDPRNGRPSWRALSQMCGISTTTIVAMAFGQRKTSAATIARVAEALRVEACTVSTWLPSVRVVREAWDPPTEVRFLTTRQLRALDEFIRATADAMGGDGDAKRDTASIDAARSAKQRRELSQELLEEAAWEDEGEDR